MIVEKAVKMANMMNIPILGIVENNSYFKCPSCEVEHKIYGESHIDEIAKGYGVPVLGKLPIEEHLAKAADTGTLELFKGEWLDQGANIIEDKLSVKAKA